MLSMFLQNWIVTWLHSFRDCWHRWGMSNNQPSISWEWEPHQGVSMQLVPVLRKYMSHQNPQHESETNSSHNTDSHAIKSSPLSQKSPKCGFVVTFIKIRHFLYLFLDLINKYPAGKFWCEPVPVSDGGWGAGCHVNPFERMCLHGVLQRFMTGNSEEETVWTV